MIFCVRSFNAGMHFFKKFECQFDSPADIFDNELLKVISLSDNVKTLEFFRRIVPNSCLFKRDEINPESIFTLILFQRNIELIRRNAVKMFEHLVGRKHRGYWYGHYSLEFPSAEMWNAIFRKNRGTFFDEMKNNIPECYQESVISNLQELFIDKYVPERRSVFATGLFLGGYSSHFLEVPVSVLTCASEWI